MLTTIFLFVSARRNEEYQIGASNRGITVQTHLLMHIDRPVQMQQRRVKSQSQALIGIPQMKIMLRLMLTRLIHFLLLVDLVQLEHLGQN